MKANTLRVFNTLHTWVGLMAGWALFIAFFAGAITVFHHELHVWQNPDRLEGKHAAEVHVEGPAIDAFVQKLIAVHPDAANSVYVGLPSHEEPDFNAYWQDKAGEWHTMNGERLNGDKAAQNSTSLDHVTGELSAFLNALHYSLGLGLNGTYFMGIISILYGLALVSGVILHLPRLKKDLFAVRPGRNLKRFWMDSHNVIGLFSLPFHLIFAITGAMFCLSLVMVMVFNVLTFDGKLFETIPRVTSGTSEVSASGRPSPTMPSAQLLAIAREHGGEHFTPTAIRFQRYGDANAVADVRGESARALGNGGSVGIHAAANEPNAGKLIANQTASGRDTNHMVYSAMFALHYGTYGDMAVRIVYLIAGLAGAFLFYSGNLLWIETRRKARQAEQPRVHKLLAQATVGVCIGTCIGVALCFPAALLWPERAVSYVFWPVFGVAVAWALVRPPIRAAVELLYVAALATLTVPLADLILAGDNLFSAALQGRWVIAGFDIAAIAMAVGYVALARATQRRAQNGPVESVWAPPGAAAQAAPQATMRKADAS
ncbi:MULTISPECIES: PepSY domain-containing protein [unclassified Cupriavidus]|uniref:PepSY-associated TM helix domain-containing protein n=1 Tax=unclassified Cupriavidus TaxID=2640874 RepID=UPI0010FA53C0|nr:MULTISPECIES: PepSY-associated TM helix domain-containing protein [unclassified Cupriavidus]MWL87098.1 PepSY domain-containing protein [Cupriavidus sp. SW-Y-13]